MYLKCLNETDDLICYGDIVRSGWLIRCTRCSKAYSSYELEKMKSKQSVDFLERVKQIEKERILNDFKKAMKL